MSNCCTYGCDASPGCIGGQDRAVIATTCPPCTGDCNQGRECSAPQAKPLIWLVLDKLPAPHYCDRSKQHCDTPYTCNPLCRLIDSQLPIEMFEPPRWYQRPSVLYSVVGVGALIGFALAVYQTF